MLNGIENILLKEFDKILQNFVLDDCRPPPPKKKTKKNTKIH